MVDIFGATAADDAIQFPIFIDHEQVMQLAGGAALSLLPGDSFAGILDDLHVGRYGFSGEYTPTMNPRRANDEPEPRIPRIDFGFIGGNGRIGGLEIGFDPVGPLLYFGRFRLEAAEVVINRGHLGVLRAQRFGCDGQCAVIELGSFGETRGVLVKDREIVENLRELNVVRPERSSR